MAWTYPSNQQGIKDIHWHTTSDEGREFNARHLISEVQFPNAWGDNFSLLTILNGIELRQAEANARLAQSEAIQKNLVAALAAVAGGQAFDEAKLLDGVRASAKAGASEAFADGIDLTVKVKEG